jgi:menaquinol-cytochrome c reductase iron-sulfur subunit
MEECKECKTGIEQPSANETTRRRFLMAMMVVSSFIISLILGIPFIGALVKSRFSAQKDQWVKISEISTIPTAEPVRINFSRREQDAFLVQTAVHSVWVVKHSENDITAFSPICPHAGCYYNWDVQRRLFECPCHGSVFKIDGPVVSGPAPRPLDALPVKIENGELFITWERFKSGVPEKIVV